MANDAGATINQVVLAWLIGAEVPVIPPTGASSAAQLDESLAAADLELTTETAHETGCGPVTMTAGPARLVAAYLDRGR